MAVQFHAGTGMGPDEASVRMIAQRFLQLGQVQWISLALGGEVGMQHHWQVELRSQVVNLCQRFIIGARSIPFGQCSDVIVASKDLAYPLPKTWIELEHPADVGSGILVIGVEP